MIKAGSEEAGLELSPIHFWRREGDEFWFDVQIRPDEPSCHLKLSREQAMRLWIELGDVWDEEHP